MSDSILFQRYPRHQSLFQMRMENIRILEKVGYHYVFPSYLSSASDIWGLGLVLYHMAYGTLPWLHRQRDNIRELHALEAEIRSFQQ